MPKPNDGCALEKQKPGSNWYPVALRYQKFSSGQKCDLDAGKVIEQSGDKYRRFDWAERQSLLIALK